MTLPSSHQSTVFCDWLDVTMPPSEEYRVRSALGPIFCAADGLKRHDDCYEVGGGIIKVHGDSKWFRVSFSGSAIRMLEVSGYWETCLAEIAEGPHRVTRLDAAVDLALDGADAIACLDEKYPRGQVRLTQRPIKVTQMLSTRPDGRRTGTWYAGHRSGAEVSCKVYDKAWQVLEKTGISEPPRTRVELTVRKGPGPTLRDAFQPQRIFWHYMAPAILERPQNVPEWSSGWAEGWVMERVELLPAQALKRRIEHSPELAALIELADSIGPHGRQMALSQIRKCFDSVPEPERPHVEWEPTEAMVRYKRQMGS